MQILFHYPQQLAAALLAVESGGCCVLLSKDETYLDRVTARSTSRRLLKEILRTIHCCTDADIAIRDVKGQAPTVDCCGQTFFVSFAYDEDYLLLALSRSKAIGVDLLSKPIVFAWQDVAKNYLSPEIIESLSQQNNARAALGFAKAWVVNEARLKCLGMPLQEWSNSLELKLRTSSLSYLNDAGFPLIAIAEKNGS